MKTAHDNSTLFFRINFVRSKQLSVRGTSVTVDFKSRLVQGPSKCSTIKGNRSIKIYISIGHR